MKKLLIIFALLLGFLTYAQPTVIYGQPLSVDLSNGDVRKMLIQVWNKKGYNLRSAYIHRGKWVLVFDRDGNVKKFVSK